MNILKKIIGTKWEIFSEKVKTPQRVLDAELQLRQAEERMMREAVAVQQLLKTEGWEVFESYRQAHINFLQVKMELEPETDLMRQYQGKIYGMRWFENKVMQLVSPLIAEEEMRSAR